jgi:hypothetical protein
MARKSLGPRIGWDFQAHGTQSLPVLPACVIPIVQPLTVELEYDEWVTPFTPSPLDGKKKARVAGGISRRPNVFLQPMFQSPVSCISRRYRLAVTAAAITRSNRAGHRTLSICQTFLRCASTMPERSAVS